MESIIRKPQNMTPEAEALWEEGQAKLRAIKKKELLDNTKLFGGAALQIGSALIPGTLGLKAAGGAIKALTPYVGKKIAENVATGTISGLASGAVEGLGRGLIEGENPLKTMVSDATLGTLFGGAFGLAGGKIGKKLAEKNLQNNKIAPQKYFDDYVAGLAKSDTLGKASPFSKEFGKFRGLQQGMTPKYTEIALDSSNPLHVKQAELINKYNPAHDDYHTWIRTADDINTFEDTLKDPSYIDGGDFDPSYSRDMALQAIKDGEIDVYSSYPIDKGIFVSPSYMEAEQYAGGLGGKVYSKRVPLSDVAWIDPTQGQYAPIRELPKPIIKEEIKLTGEVPPYKESNYYKQRMQRRSARQFSS